MTEAAPFLLLAAMVAISGYAGRHIRTGPLPMQWDFRGRPIWYAPRLVALWFPVLLAVFLVIFTAAVSDDTAPGWAVPAAAFVALAIQIFYFAWLFHWQRKRDDLN